VSRLPLTSPEAIGTVDAAILENYIGYVNEHREFKDLLFGKFERGEGDGEPAPPGAERPPRPGERSVDDLTRQTRWTQATGIFVTSATRSFGWCLLGSFQGRGIRNRGKGVKSSSLTVLDDLFRRVLSALGGVLGAVGPVARESAAVGGDKGIDVVLHLPDAR
jgi:hypothetical protein